MYLNEKSTIKFSMEQHLLNEKVPFFSPLMFFFYQARVPLNSGWCTTGGTRSTV
jgi:hypothetical protein